MMRRQSLSLLSAHLRRLQQHNGHVSSSDATISLASSLEPSLLEPPLVDSSPERGHESASPLFALTRWWSPQFASNQASPFASPTSLQSVLQLPSEPSPERNRGSVSPLFALNQTPRRRNPSALAWSHGACSRSMAVSVSPVNRRSDEASGFGRPSVLLRVPTKQPLRLNQLLLLSASFSTDASSGSPPPPMPADLAAVVERRLSAVMARHQQLEELLSQPDTSADDLARAGKEMSELAPAVAIALELQKKTKELEDLHALLRGQEQHYKEDKEGAEGKTEGDREDDEELRAMVEEEAGVVGRAREALLRSAVRRILPRDEADSRGCILEVREGEAREAMRQLSLRHLPHEASASISGDGAFGWLKGESGVHRVQRVPTTEKAGRVHTSAATVAVLPQADEVDMSVRQEDLRIDTYRSGGAGGQSVNTTSSAVRITHIPTGIVVAIQDELSQHQNKAKALKVLRARLFDAQRKQAEASRSQLRHGQIGSGDRSERIRTYNFPQGRITDHRVGLTLHSLPQVLQGEGLETFIEALEAAAEKEAIDALAKAD
ncbi:hypothetical protein CLOM_g22046 [Closterium sp. NIES-68]|nr:hypothetical protein CLOM_g22046 [Closterium sp. NIES-68]GJP77768.1 hypothetical protein CLOP_g8117 [Closterium sp. NIES-67]